MQDYQNYQNDPKVLPLGPKRRQKSSSSFQQYLKSLTLDELIQEADNLITTIDCSKNKTEYLLAKTETILDEFLSRVDSECFEVLDAIKDIKSNILKEED